ncbi:MAG: glycosyltransferase family 4 protein [Patescibacteria group bacterium]|nr:glycosyltransferase family 4 protein [Patescibacteria group bacterium]
MKVAIVTPVFPPYGGGMGVIAYHHARILTAAGFTVSVFTPDYGRSRPAYPGLSIEYLPPTVRYGNAAWLPQLARLGSFPVVHFHAPFLGAARAIVEWRRHGHGRLLVHYHMDLEAPGLRGLAFSWWRSSVLPRLISAADAVAVPTFDYAWQSALTPYLRGQVEKFFELPNGVDATRFTPGRKSAALLEHFQLTGKRIVLFVGGLDAAHYFKGVPVLLEALSQLPQDVGVLIVGSGALVPGLKKLAVRLQVAERAVFAGAISDDELPAYYRSAEVVVLPSLTRSEAFGIVLLEGMACGKPAVASALPGVRTVVADGVTGYLAQPGDAGDLSGKLRALLDDPAKAAAFGEAGRQRVLERYDWAVVGKQLVDRYRKLAP